MSSENNNLQLPSYTLESTIAISQTLWSYKVKSVGVSAEWRMPVDTINLREL